MKNRILALAIFALLATVAFAQGGAATTTAATPTGPAPTKIGVINIQAAIVGTKEGKNEFDSLAKKFEPKRTELAGLNDELDKLKAQFQAQQDKLSEEEKATRARDIDRRQKDLQRKFDDAQSDFTQQSNDVAGRIGNKMIDIIDKYSRANGIAVVVDVSNQQTSPVLWASELVNIGPAVVDAYDKAYPAADVPSSPAPTRPSGTTAKPPAAKPNTGSTTAPPPTKKQ